MTIVYIIVLLEFSGKISIRTAWKKEDAYNEAKNAIGPDSRIIKASVFRAEIGDELVSDRAFTRPCEADIMDVNSLALIAKFSFKVEATLVESSS